MGNELYHHGVKGQHWGIRRFQNKDGSLTEVGRSRYRTGEPQKKSSLTIKKNPITSSKSKSAPAKKEDPAKTKEQYEADKKKALKSGTAADILKFKGDLTNNEMQTALNRIDLENKLSRMASSEKPSYMKTVDSAIAATRKTTELINAMVKTKQTLDSLTSSTKKKSDPYKETKSKAQEYLKKGLGDMSMSDLNEATNLLQKMSAIEKYASSGESGGDKK